MANGSRIRTRYTGPTSLISNCVNSATEQQFHPTHAFFSSRRTVYGANSIHEDTRFGTESLGCHNKWTFRKEIAMSLQAVETTKSKTAQ
jgi:hypothetical protein